MIRSYNTTLGGPHRHSLLRPLILLVLIVVVDQLTKWVIVAQVPLFYDAGFTIEVIGDFFRITHVRNLGIAFSIGHGAPPVIRRILFVALPIAVMGILFFSFYLSRSLTQGQRWAVAAILGGGIGNIIDRIFRPGGVVDFLDVRFFGLFGLERWPTFNVADSAVVIGGIFLVFSMMRAPREDTHE